MEGKTWAREEMGRGTRGIKCGEDRGRKNWNQLSEVSLRRARNLGQWKFPRNL